MSLIPTRPSGTDFGVPEVWPFGRVSRRVAMIGAFAAAGFKAHRAVASAPPANTFSVLGGGSPAFASTLSPADARLVAIADELHAVDAACTAFCAAHPDEAGDGPRWDALIGRFDPLEQEMAHLPADTLTGMIAKARALQVPTCSACESGIADSIAADLMRLGRMGALS